jgi:hypothetical protein
MIKRITLLAICRGLFAAMLLTATAHAQQQPGDKEIGIGGLAYFNHTSDFTGNATVLFSLGYFQSRKNYFGFEVDPSFTFQHASGGGNSVDLGAFMLGNYRRFLGSVEDRRVFPFVGGGGGGYFTGTIGSGGGVGKSGLGFAEVGLKSYLSQKTSLEFTYKFLYVTAGGDSFLQNTLSLASISLRHIF